MIVNNDDLVLKIEEWNDKISKNKELLEVALFKIFIEFEKFLTHAFLSYALGKEGKNNFSPILRINFEDKEQLQGILKCDNLYIDYIKKIPKIKKFIFDESSCPFHKVSLDPKFNTLFNEIQAIRNFFAHESEESKLKYKNNVLRAYNISTYIDINNFLSKTNKQHISYYSLYVNAIKFYSEVICDPRSE